MSGPRDVRVSTLGDDVVISVHVGKEEVDMGGRHVKVSTVLVQRAEIPALRAALDAIDALGGGDDD